jgi:hypothetical protein
MEHLYVYLASKVGAVHNCVKSCNVEWQERHTEAIEAAVREYMPSGSGFDNGTELDLAASTSEKLVFNTSFHHMDESGGYCGWTDHTITARPSFLGGFSLTITGSNRNDFKEYAYQAFAASLETRVDASGARVESLS